jgi:hypothetical protein
MTTTKRVKFIQHNKGEGKIYMPNEIFKDLQSAIDRPTHIAFAYSYYYLINYLYRYTKYINDPKPTQQLIKEFLGYSPTNKQIDYIIKKGGVLDQIEYTTTTTDYPIAHTMDENNKPTFITIKEWKNKNKTEAKYLEQDRNFKIKYPKKAFYRDKEAEEGDYLNGTFYDSYDTHAIRVEEFLRMFDNYNQELGCIGFYIYGYLIYLMSYYGSWVSIGIRSLAQKTKLAPCTVVEYTKKLKEYNFIYIDEQDFFHNPACMANVYTLP